MGREKRGVSLGMKIKRFFYGENFFLLILPLLVYLIFFYAYPVLQMISRSFYDPTWTLKHYAEFFKSPAFSQIMFNTFSIAFWVTLLSLVLGYPIAYLLTIVSARTSQVLVLFIVIPFWISTLVRTYAWMVLLGRNGILNQVLMKVGLLSAPLPLMHNRLGVFVGMLNVLLPFMILPLYSVMKGIDRNLVKSAQILGAPPWKSFLKVFFPLSLPGVAGRGSSRFHHRSWLLHNACVTGRPQRHDDLDFDSNAGRGFSTLGFCFGTGNDSAGGDPGFLFCLQSFSWNRSIGRKLMIKQVEE